MKNNGVETEFIGFAGRTHASADPVNAKGRARLWVDWVKRHMGEPLVPWRDPAAAPVELGGLLPPGINRIPRRTRPARPAPSVLGRLGTC